MPIPPPCGPRWMCSPAPRSAPRGRRIAVLGDMLELGEGGPAHHRELADPIRASGIDTVFCCGPLMRELWYALPSDLRGGYAPTSASLTTILASAIRPGDTLMVKGSNGSRMGPLVKALADRFRAVKRPSSDPAHLIADQPASPAPGSRPYFWFDAAPAGVTAPPARMRGLPYASMALAAQ